MRYRWVKQTTNRKLLIQKPDIKKEDGLLRSISKGRRLIILGTGNETGIVPYLLVFHVKFHYHREINFAIYTKWIEEKLILFWQQTAYHNVEKVHKTCFNKDSMEKWLVKYTGCSR